MTFGQQIHPEKDKLRLALVFHAHQPAAATDEAVEKILRGAYLPTLEKLTEHDWLHFSVHFSGSLLDRLERLAPGLIRLVQELVTAGRLELLAGGYHEPLLPLIPSRDRQAQVKALRAKIRKTFGYDARGAWIAERFWEPSLPQDLHESDIDYVFLDEHGFIQSGFEERELSGPFLCEDQGKPVSIFPISKTLRYLLPFADVEQIRRVLMERAVNYPGSVWVFADDLEKFGAWPGTWELVHQRGWLADFLQMLAANERSLRTITPGLALKESGVRGMAYLPGSSYPEMMRWTLPPNLRPDSTRFGNPRHFLVRYPEVNLLHKRMLMASEAVYAAKKPGMAHVLGGYPHDGVYAPKKPGMAHVLGGHLDLLWQSQSSGAYWYGWFGGAYNPALRLHARAAACRAEALALRKSGKSLMVLEKRDLDLCGEEEAILANQHQWLLFKTRSAALIAWEDRSTGFDRLGCMASHPEEGDGGLSGGVPAKSRHFGMDGSLKPFEDIFLPNPEAPMPESKLSSDGGDGCPRYDSHLEERENLLIADFAAVCRIALPQGIFPLQIRKRFQIPSQGRDMHVAFELHNVSESRIEMAYATHIPMSVPLGRSTEVFQVSFPEIGVGNLEGNTRGEVSGVQEILLADVDGECLRISADRPLTVWYHPLHTTLMVEGKWATIVQGMALFFVLPFCLEAGEALHWNLVFSPVDPHEKRHG